MTFKKIGTSLLTTLLLTASATIMADDKVQCPSAASVAQSWQLIDTISVLNPSKFAIWSVNYLRDGGYDWTIVTYSESKDLNNAYIDGQNNVKNITSPKQQYAIDMKDALLCGYNTPNESLGVGLIAYKNDRQTVRFGRVDFKLLNAH